MNRPWRTPTRALDPESVLEENYGKLRKWSLVLTRGDRELAEEIVQDLCLYFTVSRPDLSEVKNLDGYLYTSLRHIYLSALSRSSRQAMQTISVEDFDSIYFALKGRSSESILDRQNKLRRICNYAVWRKNSSKSASYFILHFFHGYERREIATIACLPIAAIYNKLKVAREEAKAHLDESGKLSIASRETPPEPQLYLSPVSSSDLFDDLLRMIFEGNGSECLSEQELVSHYEGAHPRPIPCDLLSHVVGCRKCLASIDEHFKRPSSDDREPPDGVWSSIDRQRSDSKSTDAASFRAMMRSVNWQSKMVRDHRPRTLSIAVNGKIAALHDVQSERSTLAARIEQPQSAEFVEVYTDQQVRLAMLPVEEFPLAGPHMQSQLIDLTDDRWLELKLSFDGQGLHSEVTYFDPALASLTNQQEAEQQSPVFNLPPKPERSSISNRVARIFAGFTPRLAFAGALSVAMILGVVGYFTYQNYNRIPGNVEEVLNRAIQVETADLKGQAEHQVLQLNALASDGHPVWHGSVDTWKESDTGRAMRRLYNSEHQIVAEAWRESDGTEGTSVAPSRENLSDADREIAASPVWQQDVSARGFRQAASRMIQIRAVGRDYELESAPTDGGSLHILLATLTLDRRLRAIGETLRVRSSSYFSEVRFIQTNYERRPSKSVPANAFGRDQVGDFSASKGTSSTPRDWDRRFPSGSDAKLVQLHIAVLYELNELGADTGEPIELARTPDGRIRVSGTLSDDGRTREIKRGLEALADHQLLDIRLESQGNLRAPRTELQRATRLDSQTYNVAQTEAPADSLLQKYFAGKGWTSERTKSATAQFSQDVLRHSQRALQHAYALDRLGAQFTPNELQAAGQPSDRLWTEMAKRHAAALESELRELRTELLQFEPAKTETPNAGKITIPMESPTDFALASRALLREIQSLNVYIGEAFTTSLTVNKQRSPEQMISDAIGAIPTQDAGKMAAFATRLSNSESASTIPTKHAKEE